jgi:DNA-directed RNA polymerase sigma subunit (sigma70/sigma32)
MTTTESWLRNEGMTIRQIARELRISPMRVRQLEARALEKIHENPGLLLEFLDFETTRATEGPHR